MRKEFKNTVIEEVRKKYDAAFYIEDSEWNDVWEQTQRHLFVNNILYQKDIKFQDFIDGVWQYISIKRYSLK